MTKAGLALIALVCLGPPFYWGTLRNSLLVPLLWSALMGIAIGFRRWKSFDLQAGYLLATTLSVSAAACVATFYVGHALGLAD